MNQASPHKHANNDINSPSEASDSEQNQQHSIGSEGQKPGFATHPSGEVRPLGKIRSPMTIIVLSIITLGIYFIVFCVKSFNELEAWRKDGLHGTPAVLVSIFVGIAALFLLPGYIGEMYEEDGKPAPMSATFGLWNFLPILGGLIWLFGVTNKMNTFWKSKGQTK